MTPRSPGNSSGNSLQSTEREGTRTAEGEVCSAGPGGVAQPHPGEVLAWGTRRPGPRPGRGTRELSGPQLVYPGPGALPEPGLKVSAESCDICSTDSAVTAQGSRQDLQRADASTRSSSHGLRCGRSSATRAEAACPGCFLADVTMHPRRNDSQADTAQKGERAAAPGQSVGTSQQETSPGHRGQDVKSESEDREARAPQRVEDAGPVTTARRTH